MGVLVEEEGEGGKEGEEGGGGGGGGGGKRVRWREREWAVLGSESAGVGMGGRG